MNAIAAMLGEWRPRLQGVDQLPAGAQYPGGEPHGPAVVRRLYTLNRNSTELRLYLGMAGRSGVCGLGQVVDLVGGFDERGGDLAAMPAIGSARPATSRVRFFTSSSIFVFLQLDGWEHYLGLL